jgi:hypothetical protein
MNKQKLSKKNELSRQRRDVLKLSVSLFAVGVISGGLGVGSAYLLTGGTRLKNTQKTNKFSK